MDSWKETFTSWYCRNWKRNTKKKKKILSKITFLSYKKAFVQDTYLDDKNNAEGSGFFFSTFLSVSQSTSNLIML